MLFCACEVLFEWDEFLCPPPFVFICSKLFMLPDNLEECIIEIFKLLLLPLVAAVLSLDPYRALPDI